MNKKKKKNTREKLGHKRHNRIRMGTGNKWGKWNTNEGLKLENRASTRGENEGVDGLRCLRRFRLERKKKKTSKEIYSARNKQIANREREKERSAYETGRETR